MSWSSEATIGQGHTGRDLNKKHFIAQQFAIATVVSFSWEKNLASLNTGNNFHKREWEPPGHVIAFNQPEMASDIVHDTACSWENSNQVFNADV